MHNTIRKTKVVILFENDIVNLETVRLFPDKYSGKLYT